MTSISEAWGTGGAGCFGRWVKDSFGLPAFEYELDQFTDPRGRWRTHLRTSAYQLSELAPEEARARLSTITGLRDPEDPDWSNLHWHQVGNDRLIALATDHAPRLGPVARAQSSLGSQSRRAWRPGTKQWPEPASVWNAQRSKGRQKSGAPSRPRLPRLSKEPNRIGSDSRWVTHECGKGIYESSIMRY